MIRHTRQAKRYHPYHRPTNARKNLIVSKTKLFPVQEVAMEALDIYRKNGCDNVDLCYQMGLGKTLISLTHASLFGWRVIYLCPSAIVNHVYNQISTHFKGVRVGLGFFSPRAHVTLISYQQICRFDKTDAIFNYTFNTCIIDEVHTIRSCNNKTSTNIDMIKSRFYMGLSATPHKKRFLRFFTDNTPRIENIRYCDKKEEKGEGKEAQHSHEYIDLSSAQRQAYSAEIARLQLHNYKNPMLILQPMRKFLSDLKVSFVLSWLRNQCQPLKICICSESNAALFDIAMNLPKSMFVRADSTLSKTVRQQQLKIFENKEEVSILLANRSVIGMGIDMGFADIIVLVEPTFNKRETEQLIGRLTRIGQHPRNVHQQQIVEFVFRDTCEEQLLLSNGGLMQG